MFLVLYGKNESIFPQIAIAIGVLTSNTGGGRRTTLADWTCRVQWTWCHCGAIAHCSVVWCGEGRATTNFGGVDVVPLLGAIVVCYGRGGNFGGVDVVPLLDAIAGCHCSVLWLGGG